MVKRFWDSINSKLTAINITISIFIFLSGAISSLAIGRYISEETTQRSKINQNEIVRVEKEVTVRINCVEKELAVQKTQMESLQDDINKLVNVPDDVRFIRVYLEKNMK